jgi:hypothetical protein
VTLGENELRIAQLTFQRKLQSVSDAQPVDTLGRPTASISQVSETVSQASLSNRELRKIIKKAKSQSSTLNKKPSYVNRSGARRG